MKKFVQPLFLLVLLFMIMQTNAQSNRMDKKYAVPQQEKQIQQNPVEVKDKNYESVPASTEPEIKMKKVLTKSVTSENKEKRVPSDKQHDKDSVQAVDSKVLPENNNMNIDLTTTYIREETTGEEKNTNSEVVKQKPVKSENYKPHTVREDIQNVQVQRQSSSSISDMKKTYLKEEAAELEKEIELFKNDPNYNLAEKQKQLADIKKLIQ